MPKLPEPEKLIPFPRTDTWLLQRVDQLQINQIEGQNEKEYPIQPNLCGSLWGTSCRGITASELYVIQPSDLDYTVEE